MQHTELQQQAWQQAYQWLCHQRRHAPANSDIWHLRFHWSRLNGSLYEQVLRGEYHLTPMQLIERRGDDNLMMWTAVDALVLKWAALLAEPELPLHSLCHHTKGKGVHYSVREVAQRLHSVDDKFVWRTDIKGYYQNINKQHVKKLLHQRLSNVVVIKLIDQFVDYSVESGGKIYTPLSGISRGCALSPLIGAALLHHIDSYFAACDEVFYVRYMDDFLLLSPTRWGLRRAIARMQAFFNQSGFTCHPDKTQLGRREKGFDWLGIWFAPDGPTIAPRALQNHRDRCVRLYEQARLRGLSDQDACKRVQAYRTRWDNWARTLQMQMTGPGNNTT